MKSSNQERKPERVIDPDTIYQTLTDQLELYCAENRIEDMRTESESGWQAFLQWAFMLLFWRGPDHAGFDNVQSVLMFDDNDLYIVFQWFTLYSRKNNKTCNPYNFSILTGISLESIYEWMYADITIQSINADNNNIYKGVTDNGRIVTHKRRQIAKNLYKSYEESLAAALTTGKNPVGIIATLNRRYGWNAAEMSIQSKPQMIAAQDLPALAPPDPE